LPFSASHDAVVRIQSIARHPLRFGEKQATGREDSCCFAGDPIGYCIGRYCRKADNESLAECCEGCQLVLGS
jgi:hypothetical protein